MQPIATNVLLAENPKFTKLISRKHALRAGPKGMLPTVKRATDITICIFIDVVVYELSPIYEITIL